jgi:hypothetical protein
LYNLIELATVKNDTKLKAYTSADVMPMDGFICPAGSPATAGLFLKRYYFIYLVLASARLLFE